MIATAPALEPDFALAVIGGGGVVDLVIIWGTAREARSGAGRVKE